MANLTNRQIDCYRVLGKLAAGGFATLWKACHADDRRRYFVVKLMRPDKAKRRGDRALFEREYRLGRDFDHPGLLGYHALGQLDGLPYIVMDFFDGKSLKTLIAEEAPLVRNRVRPIVSTVAGALGHLHGRGIVHRDVKPENILANDDGERLIDFSIAQTKWQRLNPFDRALHGTPSYLAPEVVGGARPGPACDIYALGAVLFEMLAGRPPFVGESDQQVMQKHMRETPPRLSRLNPHVSTKLDKLVASMLAKDPARRPADAADLVERLDKTEVYAEA